MAPASLTLSDLEDDFSCLKPFEISYLADSENIALFARICLHANQEASRTYKLTEVSKPRTSQGHSLTDNLLHCIISR